MRLSAVHPKPGGNLADHLGGPVYDYFLFPEYSQMVRLGSDIHSHL